MHKEKRPMEVTMNDRRSTTAFSATPAAAAPPAPPQRPTVEQCAWLNVFGEFTKDELHELSGIIRRHGFDRVKTWLKAWAKDMLALSELKERGMPNFDDTPMGYIRSELVGIDGIAWPGTR
jgi:hypothetical protein